MSRSQMQAKRTYVMHWGFPRMHSRPESLPFTKLLLSKGLQRPDGIETDLGTAIGKLRTLEQ